MIAAMEAVKSGTTSINKAASLHGVLCTTLKDRISGRVKHGSKPGPQQYLNVEEEKELADHLVHVARVGYGKTRKQVLSIAEQVAKERKDALSNGWWRRFLERQSQLSLRKGDATAHVRMDATNEKVMKAYYDLLQKILEESNLMNSSAQLYNMDETLTLTLLISLIGVVKRKFGIVCPERKNRSQHSGVEMPLASPSHRWLFLKANYLNHEWTKGEVPGTYYRTSGKGWTDQELFRLWLKNHIFKVCCISMPPFPPPRWS